MTIVLNILASGGYQEVVVLIELVRQPFYVIRNCFVFSSSQSESRKVNLRSKFTFLHVTHPIL